MAAKRNCSIKCFDSNVFSIDAFCHYAADCYCSISSLSPYWRGVCLYSLFQDRVLPGWRLATFYVRCVGIVPFLIDWFDLDQTSLFWGRFSMTISQENRSYSRRVTCHECSHWHWTELFHASFCHLDHQSIRFCDLLVVYSDFIFPQYHASISVHGSTSADCWNCLSKMSSRFS